MYEHEGSGSSGIPCRSLDLVDKLQAFFFTKTTKIRFNLSWKILVQTHFIAENVLPLRRNNASSIGLMGLCCQRSYCDLECASCSRDVEHCQCRKVLKYSIFNRRNSVVTVMISVPFDVLKQYCGMGLKMGLLPVQSLERGHSPEDLMMFFV